MEEMLWRDGIAFEELHLDRMVASATYFGWPFGRAAAKKLIASHTDMLQPTMRFRVRLQLAANGRMHLRVSSFSEPKRHGRIRLMRHVMAADDVFRRHQTTCRQIYDRLLPKARQEGLDDFIFSNDRGELTEGTTHSFFIKRGSKLLTPPINCGVLPGIYRRHILDTNPCAEEQVLRPRDLQRADGMYLTNSLVGMFSVKLSL